LGGGTSIAVPHHVQFAAGDRVTVRGDRWIVDDATTFGDCTLLSLSATDRPNTPRTCRLLLPFDRPVAAIGTSRVQPVTRRRWMRLLQAELSDLRIFGQLRAASRASIDILPFQLEPALALIAGRASRFLLADEVGLGKTIQAGLMLAELQHRGWCERALIVTPSGLRHQWADELRRRFDIRAAVVDATALSALTNSLPLDVNPWASEPVSIASVDFVKQPEVLRGLCRQVWDMLIVDEAHRASAASLRYDALAALAGRSREVVLLTATPHAGDEAAYRALCDLGKLDHGDPMFLFRRTREQAGLPRTRRVHLLPVKLSADAAAMHRMLAAYVARLWKIAHETGSRDVQLVAMVLNKRAFSSACSLAASIERRLAGLIGSPSPFSQSSLPFDVDADAADDAPDPVAPAFDRSSEDETALRQLLEITRRAQIDEPKVRALRRLLRRVREPAIVFTEYRDTLKALEAAVTDLRKTTSLHGGQTPEERRDSVDAFASGRADLLLATDAGAEGLNLQSRCRLVVNLELPWNPIRLEQRIGRVDRIGQRRTVHAINLFADGTAESTVLACLLHRMDRIHASEIEIAASVIDGAALPTKRPDPVLGGPTETIDLAARARAEASRIRKTRAFQKMPPAFHKKIIPVTVIRSLNLGPNDQALQPSAVWLIRIRIATRAGRLVEDTLVPVKFPFHDGECHGRRRQIRSVTERMLAEFKSSVIAFVTRIAEERAAAIARESAEWVARALRRERRMAGTSAAGVMPPIQAGLFDNRALKRRQMAEQLHHSIFGESADRSSLLEAGATAALAHEPEIALVLITC
jgi:superfamily II DNA or RNA helicase